jgi:hypothetical protein
MDTKQKTRLGSPADWGTAIGVLIAVIGLLSLISGAWTPDAAESAKVGFLGANSTLPSVIILVVGIIIAVASQVFLKKEA